MSIKIKSIEPNIQSIHTQLIFNIDIDYDYKYNYPIQISGVLSITNDYKEIAMLFEYKNSRSDIEINLMDSTTQSKQRNLYQNNRENFKLFADLTPKAIEHIEKIRQTKTPSDVEFRVELQVKYIYADYNCTEQETQTIKNKEEQDKLNLINKTQGRTEQRYNTTFLKINIKTEQDTFKIQQSEWITKFADKLGIGKFTLVELKLPEINNFESEKWKEIYERMILRLNNTEEIIRKGDWESALLQLRNFFELFKNEEFRTYLKELFIKDRHEESGIKEFYEGINKFFHFLSKYVHDNDQKQQLKSVPKANKEDVYLFYSLALSILNLISKKLEKEEE